MFGQQTQQPTTLFGAQPQQQQPNLFGTPQNNTIGGLNPLTQTNPQTNILGGNTTQLVTNPLGGTTNPPQNTFNLVGGTSNVLGGNTTNPLQGGTINPLGGGMLNPQAGGIQPMGGNQLTNPLGLSNNVIGGLNQMGNPQQQQQQQQQQQKVLSIGQLKTQVTKHYENLVKAATIKEQFETNQNHITKIEKNALQITLPQMQNNFVNPNQTLAITNIKKNNEKTYTGKTEKMFRYWKEQVAATISKQDDTIAQLEDLNNLLLRSQVEEFTDFEEETLIDAIKQLNKELGLVENRVIETMKLQQNILGAEKEENDWDVGVKNLSECFIMIDQQTTDLEDLLAKCESHERVRNR